MARFTAECPGYQEACTLINTLKIEGIEANITAGGVAIHLTPDQIPQAKAICKAHKCSFDPGYSSHQESIMTQSESGYQTVVQVTDDAISVLKEWE